MDKKKYRDVYVCKCYNKTLYFVYYLKQNLLNGVLVAHTFNPSAWDMSSRAFRVILTKRPCLNTTTKIFKLKLCFKKK